MRRRLIGLSLLLGALTPAYAQLSINFGAPGVNVGINVGSYPALQRVPGYPVYYAPGVNSNYFFYDGLYWVFQNDNWYASSWYNGPWSAVDSMDVPDYVLRVPVRYYRHAPSYFKSWRADDAPRWGDHWGASWEQRHVGWDHWNRDSAPAPAPLPAYQKQYSGSRYPQGPQQAVIETQNYRYEPTDAVARQHVQQRQVQAQQAPQNGAANPRQPLQTHATQQRPSPETGRTPAQQPQAPQQQANTQPQQQQTRGQQPQRQRPEQAQQQAPQQQARPQQAQPAPQAQNALERKAPQAQAPQAQAAQQQAAVPHVQQAPRQEPQQARPQPAPVQREAQAAREQVARPQAQERAPQAQERAPQAQERAPQAQRAPQTPEHAPQAKPGESKEPGGEHEKGPER
jgi:hypothetical protein